MKPREAAITYLKKLLQSEEIECLKEDSVNQGYGLKLSGEHQGGAFLRWFYILTIKGFRPSWSWKKEGKLSSGCWSKN